MNTKDTVITHMLKKDTESLPSRPLISEIGSPEEESKPNVLPVTTDGPSMLELMMEAHKSAIGEKKASTAKTNEVESKKSFGGFKKGFFASNDNPKQANTIKAENSSKSASSSSKSNLNQTQSVTELKAQGGQPKSTLVLDDVQHAMEEDQHPLLKQLRSQDWISEGLLGQFQSNPIVARGLQHPKCMAAIQLMQQNPKEALNKFQSDPEVTMFLQEFGKIMSAHFEALGAQQEKTKNASSASSDTQSSSMNKIEEIGPLQAAALKKQKEGSDKDISKSKSNDKKIAKDMSEQERVQQILNDADLRSLLMDTELQKVLMECSHPQKLQAHMRNPDMATKIRRLAEAGLVKIEL